MNNNRATTRARSWCAFISRPMLGSPVFPAPDNCSLVYPEYLDSTIADSPDKMETGELTDFFQANWNGHVRRLGDSLDSDDVETVRSFKSWADVEILLRNLAPSIGLIQPAVRHLHFFVNFFETRFGSQPDTSYFWGSIGCLMQLTANPEDSEMLEKVPRMIKAIAHKAEAFNTYCASVS
ncbi:hypothetical protein B0H67DRAFT_557282 [Lasiosphaeris hirsuta]|uniref:Uncharacterized protein n=1 Tax=Lasiosphaeris hirsuta TaxID=260670 RepID=A0AA40DKC0_9PEZI|nr:hypothetical protein B0H67DRAFT_557282 [Lasiosphaeris hirsuta]